MFKSERIDYRSFSFIRNLTNIKDPFDVIFIQNLKRTKSFLFMKKLTFKNYFWIIGIFFIQKLKSVNITYFKALF
jgi:hypothetical protein